MADLVPLDPFTLIKPRSQPDDPLGYLWQQVGNVGRATFGVPLANTIPRPMLGQQYPDAWGLMPHVAGASDFADMAAKGEKLPGANIFQILDSSSNGAEALLKKLGFDSIKSDREIYMLNMANVRDAQKAMFNPAMRRSTNPFASVMPPALTFGALYPMTPSLEEKP